MSTSYSATTDQSDTAKDKKKTTGFSSVATGKTSYFNPGPAMEHKNRVWNMSRDEKLDYAMRGGMS